MATGLVSILRKRFPRADGRNEPTVLTKLILEGHRVETTDELFNLIYSSDYTNARLASFGSYLQKRLR